MIHFLLLRSHCLVKHNIADLSACAHKQMCGKYVACLTLFLNARCFFLYQFQKDLEFQTTCKLNNEAFKNYFFEQIDCYVFYISALCFSVASGSSFNAQIESFLLVGNPLYWLLCPLLLELLLLAATYFMIQKYQKRTRCDHMLGIPASMK